MDKKIIELKVKYFLERLEYFIKNDELINELKQLEQHELIPILCDFMEVISERTDIDFEEIFIKFGKSGNSFTIYNLFDLLKN